VGEQEAVNEWLEAIAIGLGVAVAVFVACGLVVFLI
jgi:hypothetical protein